MMYRHGHNIWKKVIAMGLVCLFLVNTTFQGLSYAYYDTLATNVSLTEDDIPGAPEARQAVRQLLSVTKEMILQKGATDIDHLKALLGARARTWLQNYRRQNIDLTITPPEGFSSTAADSVAAEIKRLQDDRPGQDVVIVLATGTTMIDFLPALAQHQEIDWRRVQAFHLDDWAGLAPDNTSSLAHYLKMNFFEQFPDPDNRIPDEKIHYINGADPDNWQPYMDRLRELGGADIGVVGIGTEGHIGLNERGDAAFDSRIRRVELAHSTIVAQRERHPDIGTHGVTMGMADIAEFRHVFCLVNGGHKAEAFQRVVEGPVTEEVSASILQRCPTTFIADRDAASWLAGDYSRRLNCSALARMIDEEIEEALSGVPQAGGQTTTADAGQPQPGPEDRDTLPAVRVDRKTGRPKVGEGLRVAQGRITIPRQGLKLASIEKSGVTRRRRAVEKTAGLLEEALKFLSEFEREDVVKKVVRKLVDEETELPLEFMDDHDLLMDIAPVSDDVQQGDRRKIRIDIDAERDLGKRHREGLKVLMALGLLHEFYHKAGMEEEDALIETVKFYKVLRMKNHSAYDALREVLLAEEIDHGNTFRTFLAAAIVAKNEEEQRILARGLMNTRYVPARRDLLVFSKPEAVEIRGTKGESMQFPQWQEGREIASGTVGLSRITPTQKRFPIDKPEGGEYDRVIDAWEGVMSKTMGILHENGELLKNVIGTWRKRSEGGGLSCAILEGHDHVCDLYSANGRFKVEGGEVTMRFDAETLSNIADMPDGTAVQRRKKEATVEGLALIYSIAMVYFWNRQLGLNEREAYEEVFKFYQALNPVHKRRLGIFLASSAADVSNTFFNFLKTASGLKGTQEQRQAQLDHITQLLRLEAIAGPAPFELERAKQILTDEEDFSDDTNQALYQLIKETYRPEVAREYYKRLCRAARDLGYTVVTQRSSRVSQSQGAVLSASEVVIEPEKLREGHTELMAQMNKIRDTVSKMVVGGERLWTDGEIDTLMSEFDFEEKMAEFVLSREPVPVAKAKRMLKLYENARDKVVRKVHQRIREMEDATYDDRRQKRALSVDGVDPRDKEIEACYAMIGREIEAPTEVAFFRFRNVVADAEKFQDILNILVQRLSPRSAHLIVRLLLGYKVYKETAPGMPETRMRAASNMTIAPSTDVAVEDSSVYCENAALSVKIIGGMPVVDWRNMDNIIITTAPAIYKAIKNAKRRGGPKFVYKMETTVGHGLIDLIRVRLEDEMTNMAAIEAGVESGTIGATELKDKVEEILNEVYSVGQEVCERYKLESDIREIMDIRGVTRREATLEVIESYSDVRRDIGYLLMIKKEGLVSSLERYLEPGSKKRDAAERYAAARVIKAHGLEAEAEVEVARGELAKQKSFRKLSAQEQLHQARLKVLNKKGKQAWRFEYQQALHTRAYEDVLLELPEWKEQIEKLIQEGTARKDARDTVRKQLVSSAHEFMTEYLTYTESTARKEILEAHPEVDKSKHAVTDGRDYHFVYNPSAIVFGETELFSVVEEMGLMVGGKPEAVQEALALLYRTNFSLAGPDIFPNADEAAAAKVLENTVRNLLHAMAAAIGMEAKAGKIDGRRIRQRIQERKATHMVLWAAAMVGGYCLTKEPLFVMLVREMTDDGVLDQLKIPKEHHEYIKKAMRRVLGLRRQFPSNIEWEEEARRILSEDKVLRAYFGDAELPNWLPHPFLIARVMGKLGDPVTEKGKYAAMVAEYAGQLFEIGLKINDLSAVARVGDIYEGLEQARRLNPYATKDEDAKILMQCAYKQDVSDVRETANMYMLLLLRGDKRRLKHYGVDARMTEIMDKTIAGKKRPASVSFTDPYVDINGFMDGEIKVHAEDLKAVLRALGLRDEQIEACTLKYGALEEWPVIQKRLDTLKQQKRQLEAKKTKTAAKALSKVNLEIARIEEAIKLSARLMDWLHMYVEGVEPDFLKASQGKDVIVLNSSHANIREDVTGHLELLYDSMSIGNPNSSRVFIDSSQQSYGPVMDWFSRLRWLNWGGVYLCADISPESIEDERQRDVIVPRQKAWEFTKALFSGDYTKAQELLEARCNEVRETIDVRLETLRLKRWEAEEIGVTDLSMYQIMEEGLIQLSRMSERGVRLEDLDFTTFLIMGGMWMLDKRDKDELDKFRKDYRESMLDFHRKKRLDPESSRIRMANLFDKGCMEALVKPAPVFTEEAARLRLAEEIKGTTKEAPLPERTAAAGTGARIAKAKEQEAVRRRFRAFEAVPSAEVTDDFESEYTHAMGVIGYSQEAGEPQINEDMLGTLLKLENPKQDKVLGEFLAYGLRAAERLVDELMPKPSKKKEATLKAFQDFYNGKTIDTDHYIALCGDHGPNPGLLHEMAIMIRDKEGVTEEWKKAQLKKIAQCGELLDTALLVGLTMHKGDTNAILNALGTYFDRTLNVHEYDYPPYRYHYLCGGGYGFDSQYFRDPDKREEMMQLCYDHHQWIYAYLRKLIVQRTPLRKKSAEYIDDFLGNWQEGRSCVLYEHAGDGEKDIFWNGIRAIRDAFYIMNLEVQEGREIVLPVFVDDVDPAAIGLGQNAVYASSNYTPGVHSTMPGISQGVRIYENYPIRGDDGRTYRVRVGYTPRPIAERVRGGREGQMTVFHAPVSYMYLSGKDCRRVGADVRVSGVGPEGIPCILRFRQKKPNDPRDLPLIDANMAHFTSQDHAHMVYEEAGLPVQWANVVERMMYKKTVLPEVIKRAMKHGEAGKYLELIPQKNFLKRDVQRKARTRGSKAVKDEIKKQLIDFAKGKTRKIVVKPSEQSGGRGADIYEIMDSRNKPILANLNRAVDLVYRTCMAGDDIVVQDYIPNSPSVMGSRNFFDRVDEEFADFGIRFLRDEKFPPTPTFFAGRSYPVQFDRDTRRCAGFNALVGVEEKVNLGQSARLFLGDPELCMAPEFAGLVRKGVDECSVALLGAIEEYAPDFVKEYGRELGLEGTEDARDLAGNPYARMVSGLFDYTPYLLVKPKNNPQSREWVKVYFEPANIEPGPDGEVKHGKGLRFYIYDDKGEKVAVDLSQEEVVRRLKEGTMELKIAFFELNSGIGQVVQHQRALKDMGIIPSELVQEIWGNLAKRGLAYRQAMGRRNKRLALRGGRARATARVATRRRAEPEDEKERWFNEAVEDVRKDLADTSNELCSDDISLVIMRYLEKALMDELGIDDEEEFRDTVARSYQTVDDFQKLYDTCLRILQDDENHRWPLQNRLQQDDRFKVREELATRDVVERQAVLARARWSKEFVNRMAIMTLENIRQGWSLPLVRVQDQEDVMTIDDFERDLGERPNHVVICGKLNLFETPLLELAQDAEEYDFKTHHGPTRNVVGVHWKWVKRDRYTNRLTIERAMVYDRERKVLREVNLPRPIAIDSAHILHLPMDNETGMHREISKALEADRIPIVNPYGASSVADDKFKTCELMRESGLMTPDTCLIESEEFSNEDKVAKILNDFMKKNRASGERRKGFIIKPKVGTESEGVEPVTINFGPKGRVLGKGQGGNFDKALRHTLSLLRKGHDVIVQPEEGNVRYFDEAEEGKGQRKVVLNVQVQWDGNDWRADSGYAQVADKDGEAIVSIGKNASILDINETLQKLCYKNRDGQWVQLKPTAEHIADIKRAAEEAARALNRDFPEGNMLKFMGIEMLLDAIEEGGQVRIVPAVMLEANARPGGLTHSVLISDLPIGEDYRPVRNTTTPMWKLADKLEVVQRPAMAQVDKNERDGDTHMSRGEFVDAIQCYKRAAIGYAKIIEPQVRRAKGSQKRLAELNGKVRDAISAWISAERKERPNPNARLQGEDAFRVGRQIIEMMFSARTDISPLYREDAQHSQNMLELVTRLKPDASPALRLAAMAHDCDRVFSDKALPTVGRFKSKVKQVDHPRASADLVCGFLREANVSERIVKEVERLICYHEAGVTGFGKTLPSLDDSDRNYDDIYTLTDADSVDAFRVGAVPAILYAKEKGTLESYRQELAAKLRRIKSDEARRLTLRTVEEERPRWDRVDKEIYQTTMAAVKEARLHEGEHTLDEWLHIVENWKSSGFEMFLRERYGDDSTKLREKQKQYLKIIEGAKKSRMYDPDKPVVITATPGRVRVYGGHIDAPGLKAKSVEMASEEEMLMVVQRSDDDEVRLKSAAPGSAIEAFSIHDDGLRATRKIRNARDWERWAQEQIVAGNIRTERQRDLDMFARAIVAFYQGKYFGEQEFSGLRIYMGETNLPLGATSHPVAMGLNLAIDRLFGLGQSTVQLNYNGFCESAYIGHIAGIAHYTLLLSAKRGEMVSVRSAPGEIEETVDFPEELSVLMCDSGISREMDLREVSEKFRREFKRSPGRGAIVNRRSNHTSALAALWIRHHVRTSDEFTEEEKTRIERGMTAYERESQTNEDEIIGQLRALLPRADAGIQNEMRLFRLIRAIPERIGRRDLRSAMPEFRAQLNDIFKDHPRPEDGYRLREAALYGLSEGKRVELFVKACRSGDINKIMELKRRGHDGDRVTRYNIEIGSDDNVASVEEVGFNPSLSDEELDGIIEGRGEKPPLWKCAGTFERSLEPIDYFCDLVDAWSKKHDIKAAARVSAAGLGGGISVFCEKRGIRRLTDFLRRNYYDKLDEITGASLGYRFEEDRTIVNLKPAQGVQVAATTRAVMTASEAIAREPKRVEYPSGEPIDVASLTENDVVLVVMAGGKGPGLEQKVLHSLGGKPVAQHNIDTAHALQDIGFKYTVVVTGYKEGDVKASLTGVDAYVTQEDSTASTGVAAMQIAKIEDLLDSDALVLIAPGDTYLRPDYMERLVQEHRSKKNDVTVLTVDAPHKTWYGRIVRHPRTGKVDSILEPKDLDELERSGRGYKLADGTELTLQQLRDIGEKNTVFYVVSAKYLAEILGPVSNDNVRHDFSMNDMVRIASEKGLQVGTLKMGRLTDSLDIDTPGSLVDAERVLAEDRQWHNARTQLAERAGSAEAPRGPTGAVRLAETKRGRGPTAVDANDDKIIDSVLKEKLESPWTSGAYAIAANGQDIGEIRINTIYRGLYRSTLRKLAKELGKDPNANIIIIPGLEKACEEAGVAGIVSHEGRGIAGNEGRSIYIDEARVERLLYDGGEMDVDFLVHLVAHLDNPPDPKRFRSDRTAQGYEDRIEKLAPTGDIRRFLAQRKFRRDLKPTIKAARDMMLRGGFKGRDLIAALNRVARTWLFDYMAEHTVSPQEYRRLLERVNKAVNEAAMVEPMARHRIYHPDPAVRSEGGVQIGGEKKAKPKPTGTDMSGVIPRIKIGGERKPTTPLYYGMMNLGQELANGDLRAVVGEGLERRRVMIEHRDTDGLDDFTPYLGDLDQYAIDSNDTRRETARRARAVLSPMTGQMLAQADGTNVSGFNSAVDRLARVPYVQRGLIVSAETLLRDVGAREILERLAGQTIEGPEQRIIQQYVVHVVADNAEEVRALEALGLPNIQIMAPEEDETRERRIERLNELISQLGEAGIQPSNICIITRPQVDTQRAADDLRRDIEAKVWIAIPESLGRQQVMSLNLVFREAIEAVEGKRDPRQRVFVIDLPSVSAVTPELQDVNRDYRAAILLLKQA